jgi:2,4-dienoyl-CoA reductase-like NADH-dependent reductase (Old Yellow Enzyme family)
VGAIRPVLDQAGMLLLYRHTPVGPGYGIADSLALAEALVEAGADLLDLSPSSIDAPGDRAAPFVGLGVPVIAVNELDRVERALEVLLEHRASLVAVGRGLIADPEWANKVRAGRLDEIVECIYCDACHDDLQAGIPVGCSQW